MDSFFIKKPFYTEKATALAEIGQYVFMVQDNANKNEIKKAIKALYKVDVTSVNIINTAAKPKKYRNLKSHHSGFKKAVVTLKTGQKIDLTK